MTEELYKKYRPQSFKEIVGQDEALEPLIDMGRRKVFPHFVLLVGPSGVGKTTIIRILRKQLGCGDSDYRELNASAKETRGIGIVSQIQGTLGLAPMSGKCRAWAIDECHQLTPDAQNSLLKTLEDTPNHCYFFLSTTDPQKLKKTILTRAHVVKLRSLKESELEGLVERVCKLEGKEPLSEDVTRKLVRVSDGSARKALVVLHAIIGLEGEEKQLDAIAKGDFEAKAIEIARLLIKPGAKWNEVAAVLETVQEDVEQLRYMILGYCRKVLLGGGKMRGRAANVIDRFQDNFYDSKAAGLALACYDVIVGENDGKG